MNIFQEIQAKLNAEVEKQDGNCLHPEVVRISRELDKYLVQELKAVNLCLKTSEE